MFFCAIDEGMVPAEPRDLVQATRAYLARAARGVGCLDLVTGFDCVLRRIEAEFQTAIMLDGRVRSRTEEPTGLMHRLERSNPALEAAKNEAD